MKGSCGEVSCCRTSICRRKHRQCGRRARSARRFVCPAVRQENTGRTRQLGSARTAFVAQRTEVLRRKSSSNYRECQPSGAKTDRIGLAASEGPRGKTGRDLAKSRPRQDSSSERDQIHEAGDQQNLIIVQRGVKSRKN